MLSAITPFGSLPDGRATQLVTLHNENGVSVQLTDFGATIVGLSIPDREGTLADIVLGFNDVTGYVDKANPYFGCVLGRVANRIAHGKFTLDGVTYELALNNETNGLPCHIHGGNEGFSHRIWNAEPCERDGCPGVRFSYTSPDGEEGYPGTLAVSVLYVLTHDNTLRLEYEATTDKPTPVNLSNHAYFNLKGEGNGDVYKHEVTLFADTFVPNDRGSIPLGEIWPVVGTPMDFTSPRAIGEHIRDDDEQIEIGNGYDNTWVVRKEGNGVVRAARVRDPASGRVVECWTDQPGMHLYTGNRLDGTLTGKSGKGYPVHSAFCLETQHYADAPNQPNFPSIILRPGDTFSSVTEYRFSCE